MSDIDIVATAETVTVEADILAGPQGPPGPAGPTGATGDPGSSNQLAPRVFLGVPGNSTGYVTAADPTQLAGATQLDVRWIEDGRGTVGPGWLIAQATSAAAGACAFLIAGNAASGGLACVLYVATGGAAGVLTTSSVGVRPAAGTVASCRLTWRGSDGRVQWFTKATTTVDALVDNTGWTQAGANGTVAVGTLSDIAQPLAIGASSAGAQGRAGWGVAAVAVATTIDGTPFALWRADGMAPNFTDAYGTRWANVGTGWEWRDLAGRRIRGADSPFGDTGWRLITTWDTAGVITGTPLAAGWKPKAGNAGAIRLRRIGNQVWAYVLNVAVAVANTSDSLIPASAMTGFGAAHVAAVPVDLRKAATATVNTDVSFLSAGASTLNRVSNQTLAVDDWIQFAYLTWPCDQAWPAVLPGTAG